MRKEGMYYGATENTFISREEILKKMKTAKSDAEFITPLPDEKDFEYWSERFKERQEKVEETPKILQHMEFRLPRTSTIAFIGDQHVGSPETNYKRIEEELKAIIETPNVYAIMMGDTVDGFFWGGSAQMEQMEQAPEQYQYMRAMIKHLGKAGKLLVGFGGDHDGWAKRMGVDAISQFTKDVEAHYCYGIGYITIYIGDKDFKLTCAHRFPGSSIYNNTHPQRRALNESARGADIIAGGHTHRKGISEQGVKEFGGGGRTVHFHSVGAYKATDEYARKLGFSKQTSAEMFGTASILSEDGKITDFYDILESTKRVKEINLAGKRLK